MSPKQRRRGTGDEPEERTAGPAENLEAESELPTTTEIAAESPEATVAQEREPLTEVLSRAESAYQAYMGAQKEVARAYRANELQMQTAYKEAEAQAEKLCEQALELARNARDETRRRVALTYQTAIEVAQKAQREAEEAYDKALQELDKEYEGRVKEALQERATSIAEAWKAHSDRLEKAWRVYTKETE